MTPRNLKTAKLSAMKPAWWINAKRYDSAMPIFALSHLPPCHLTDFSGDKNWIVIHLPKDFVSPNFFEILHGKALERTEYNRAQINLARKQGKAIYSEFRGLSNLFVPVMVKGQCKAMLVTGPFLRGPVSSAQLQRHWQSLSGRRASVDEPEFMRYVRSIFNLAPLEGPAQRPFFEFMELLADLLAGEKAAEPLIKRMDKLRTEILPGLQPYRFWQAAEMMTDRVLVASYMFETSVETLKELRISRMPTTALAVLPRESGKDRRADSLEALVKASRFQKECFKLCADLPDTISGRLADYGAFFLTSPSPGKSPTQQRVELRDKAQRLTELARQKLGVTVHVGVGGSTTDLPRLFESLHESVVALHLCLQRDQPLIFYDDQVPSSSSQADAEQPLLPALFNALIEAFRQESAVNIMLTRDSYMQQIIVESTGSLVVMRTHFLDMTYALLGLAEKSSLVDPAAYTQLAKRCCGLLREAQSVSELLDAFQRVQSDLQSVFLSPATGSRDLRLSAVRQYIQENLQNQIKLKDTAVRAGLSPFHFSRAFKKHTGLGFQKYLLQQRLEKASRLLRSSQRPAYLIAQECGFYNASHFSKAFQEVFGLTPLKFRKAL